MNRLSTEQRVRILAALTEGNSVRATCRLTGAAKGTVLKLLAEVGTACAEFERRTLVNLPRTKVQVDEIWAFVDAKDCNTPKELRRSGKRGDVWTWTAICADTKLLACWYVGLRDATAAWAFLLDLKQRLARRVQLTSDRHNAYVEAVEAAFGWNNVD